MERFEDTHISPPSHEEAQVHKFYEIIWNRHDKSAIPDVLHEAFSFRGSLGEEKTGHAGFADYLDSVHRALGNYQCDIVEMVAQPGKVFARMRFTGLHRGNLLGYEATGKQVSWEGAALFHFQDGKVVGIWVLGDLVSLLAQLRDEAVFR